MTSLGQTIDERGITTPLDESDIVTDIVVIYEVLSENGDKSIRIARDEHTNWLKEVGMVSIANQIVLSGKHDAD